MSWPPVTLRPRPVPRCAPLCFAVPRCRAALRSLCRGRPCLPGRIPPPSRVGSRVHGPPPSALRDAPSRAGQPRGAAPSARPWSSPAARTPGRLTRTARPRARHPPAEDIIGRDVEAPAAPSRRRRAGPETATCTPPRPFPVRLARTWPERPERTRCSVRYTTLGGTVPEVGVTGLGCTGTSSRTGFGHERRASRDHARSIPVIHRALASDAPLLDTADVYGPYSDGESVGRAPTGAGAAPLPIGRSRHEDGGALGRRRRGGGHHARRGRPRRPRRAAGPGGRPLLNPPSARFPERRRPC